MHSAASTIYVVSQKLYCPSPDDNYLAPAGVESIVVSMSVCLSARITQKLHQFFVHVAYGRGSFLFWQGNVLPVFGMTSRFHSGFTACQLHF